MQQIRTMKYGVFTVSLRKTCLSTYNDKRYVLSDKTITVAYAKDMIQKKKSAQKKKKTSKLRKTFEQFRIISLATPCVRKQLVYQGGREIVDCISECCVNILKENVHLPPKRKSCRSKHKQKLREIAKKKVSLQQKKQIIQKDFLLEPFWHPLLPFLAVCCSVEMELAKK